MRWCGARTATAPCHKVRCGPSARRRDVAASSSATFSSSVRQNDSRPSASYERVLRYPDGKKRVIRYPLVKEQSDPSTTVAGSATSAARASRRRNRGTWDVAGLWETEPPKPGADAPSSRCGRASREAPAAGDASADATPTGLGVPASPMALLREQRSEDFARAAQMELDYVRSSFRILRDCPWQEPRSVWVLGAPPASPVSDEDGAIEMVYLRTRIPGEDVGSELAGLLGHAGRGKIAVSHLTDGYVCFQSDADARAFGERNAGDRPGLSAIEVSAPDLFAMVETARAVVVLMDAGLGETTPSLASLRSVLKNQPEL